MFSKTAKAKEHQGFQSKPIWPVCSTCEHFSSVMEEHSTWYSSWTTEKMLRCNLGGFKVGKTSTCNEWKSKAPEVDTKGAFD